MYVVLVACVRAGDNAPACLKIESKSRLKMRLNGGQWLRVFGFNFKSARGFSFLFSIKMS